MLDEQPAMHRTEAKTIESKGKRSLRVMIDGIPTKKEETNEVVKKPGKSLFDSDSSDSDSLFKPATTKK